MKYSWECFFWECRAVLSTLAVFFFFHVVGLVESVVKHALEYVLTKKIELRVEMEDFELDLSLSKCTMHGFIIYHPSIEEDLRWHYEYMIFAKTITFYFDPFELIYAFCTKNFLLLYVDQVVVTTIDLYVEGYETENVDSEGQTKTTKVLNLAMIGGEPVGNKRRKKKPTLAELRKARAEDLLQNALHEHESKNGHICNPTFHEDTSAVPKLENTNNILNSSSISSDSMGHENAMQNRGKSWASSAVSLGLGLTSKIYKMNKEVQDQGILATVKSRTEKAIAATVNKVDSVYKNAKESIGTSYRAKICELHERLRGGEPIPRANDLYVHIKTLELRDLEITLHQALPSSLRQLEKRTLRVPVVTLTDIKEGWLPAKFSFTASPAANQAGSTTARCGDKMVNMDKNTSPERMSAAVDEKESNSNDLCHHQSASENLSVTEYYTDTPMDMEATERFIISTISFYFSPIALRISSRTSNFFRHISSVTRKNYDGIPACVVGYYAERVLLYEILKGNAGKVLQDAVKDGFSWIQFDDDNPDADVPMFYYDPYVSGLDFIPLSTVKDRTIDSAKNNHIQSPSQLKVSSAHTVSKKQESIHPLFSIST